MINVLVFSSIIVSNDIYWVADMMAAKCHKKWQKVSLDKKKINMVKNVNKDDYNIRSDRNQPLNK